MPPAVRSVAATIDTCPNESSSLTSLTGEPAAGERTGGDRGVDGDVDQTAGLDVRGAHGRQLGLLECAAAASSGMGRRHGGYPAAMTQDGDG